MSKHWEDRNSWFIPSLRIVSHIQKTETFTGIQGINTQDRAIQESMGAIVDRSKEFLGPADMAIVTTRKLLLSAVQTTRDGGDPPGLAPTYYNIRASESIVPYDVDWREALAGQLYPETPAASIS